MGIEDQLFRAGDSTASQAQVQALQRRVTELQEVVNNFGLKFNFSVQLNPETKRYDVIARAQAGEKGSVLRITAEKLEYHKDDLPDLGRTITMQMLYEVLRDTANKEFMPGFVQSARNAINAGKSKL